MGLRGLYKVTIGPSKQIKLHSFGLQRQLWKQLTELPPKPTSLTLSYSQPHYFFNVNNS